MDIYKEFADLPRGRKGDKAIVIVEEEALLKLIGRARASEPVADAPWLRDPHAP